MQKTREKTILFVGMPRQGGYWLLAGLILSALIHLLSMLKLPSGAVVQQTAVKTDNTSRVPVNIVRKQKPNKSAERMIEAPMAPTAPPKTEALLGAQDHATDKQTKVASSTLRPKAADPGNAGSEAQDSRQQKKAETSKANKTSENVNQETPDKKRSLTSPTGVVSLPRPGESKPRNAYEALMPKASELVQQSKAGYQDYIDDEAELGDKIDFNTTNFRYLGYFTNVRKAFELVWTYPSEAVRRGIQGEVRLEFTIQKNGNLGRVKILDSSGHKILDDAVVEALKLASPFAPIPSGMKKDKLTIVGSFRYVLTSYAGAM